MCDQSPPCNATPTAAKLLRYTGTIYRSVGFAHWTWFLESASRRVTNRARRWGMPVGSAVKPKYGEDLPTAGSPSGAENQIREWGTWARAARHRAATGPTCAVTSAGDNSGLLPFLPCSLSICPSLFGPFEQLDFPLPYRGLIPASRILNPSSNILGNQQSGFGILFMLPHWTTVFQFGIQPRG